jgi:hypothetical protein
MLTNRLPNLRKKFGGSFYFYMAELDAHPEAVDLHDWCSLEKEKQELLAR